MRIGLAQDEVAQKGWAVFAADALQLVGRADVALVDLREKAERERHGTIPGALHEPYPKLRDNLASGGLLSALGATRRLVFFCAYGERSAMAVQAAQEAGITSACHIQGGIAAWKDAGGPVERPAAAHI
jgi:rhodanese-related sulfurtransferase